MAGFDPPIEAGLDDQHQHRNVRCRPWNNSGPRGAVEPPIR